MDGVGRCWIVVCFFFALPKWDTSGTGVDGRIDRMAGIANILFVIAADEQVTIIVGQIKWYEMCLENYYYYDDDDDSGHRWTTDMDHGWMLCVRMFEKDVKIALYKSVSPLLPLRLFVLSQPPQIPR